MTTQGSEGSKSTSAQTESHNPSTGNGATGGPSQTKERSAGSSDQLNSQAQQGAKPGTASTGQGTSAGGDKSPGIMDQATGKAQEVFGQATDKGKEALGQATDKAQEVFGQVADKAQSFTSQGFDQAADKAQEMAGQAQQDLYERSTGLMHTLETMSLQNYYYAVFGALGATAVLLVLGRRSLASFVGLWTGIVLNLGLFGRLLRTAEEEKSWRQQGRGTRS